MHKNLVREEDQSPRESGWALTKACGEAKAAAVSFFPNHKPSDDPRHCSRTETTQQSRRSQPKTLGQDSFALTVPLLGLSQPSLNRFALPPRDRALLPAGPFLRSPLFQNLFLPFGSPSTLLHHPVQNSSTWKPSSSAHQLDPLHQQAVMLVPTEALEGLEGV